MGSRGAETGTLRDHATTPRRGQALSPSEDVHSDSMTLERCFATSAIDKMPLHSQPVFPSTPPITWSCFKPRVPSLRHSPDLTIVFTCFLSFWAFCVIPLDIFSQWRSSTQQETSSSALVSRASDVISATSNLLSLLNFFTLMFRVVTITSTEESSGRKHRQSTEAGSCSGATKDDQNCGS